MTFVKYQTSQAQLHSEVLWLNLLMSGLAKLGSFFDLKCEIMYIASSIYPTILLRFSSYFELKNGILCQCY